MEIHLKVCCTSYYQTLYKLCHKNILLFNTYAQLLRVYATALSNMHSFYTVYILMRTINYVCTLSTHITDYCIQGI